MLRFGTLVLAVSASLAAGALPTGFGPFGTVTVGAALNLNGTGTDVDSIAFWEAPEPADTLMFVTAKGNNLVEVWGHPFANAELPAIPFPANVNGVAVDQATDVLYVSDQIVSVIPLPGRQVERTIGQGIIGPGENNLALLRHSNGETWIFVSDDHNVHRFNATTAAHLGSFAPPVSSLETLVADDHHQMVLVTEEQGPEGNPGVYAYHPDGTPFLRNGTNRFGNDGEFTSDEEGILIYQFPAHGTNDDGSGFVVVSDQRSDVTDFEVFNRETWEHLGTLRLQGVSNTDGIASTQRWLPGYPLGLFAAIDDDGATAVVGWDTIFAAMGWDPAPEAVRIAPAITAPIVSGAIEFAVEFNEPVSGFNDAADLTVMHQGTAHTGVTIAGTGASFTVTLTGVSGDGSLTLAVTPDGGVRDLAQQPLTSSVTSASVDVRSPYRAWATATGLIAAGTDGPTDNPDDDALPNLAEFATDGDPLRGTDSGHFLAAVEDVGGLPYLTCTFPVRSGATFAGSGPLSAARDGVNYSIAATLNLAEFDEPLVELSPPLDTGLPALHNGWNYRTFRLSRPVPDLTAGFLQLSIGPTAP